MTEDTPIKDMARLVAYVVTLVTEARDYLEEQGPQRRLAMEYYAGEMRDLPAKEGRSRIVSQDVRAVMKKVMPSIMRTILSGGHVVKYLPVGQGDDEGAQQASEYVNLVVIPECQAEKAIHDAIHDALLLKTGILKWCAYKRRKVTIQDYTDQPDQAVIGLFDDPDAEILHYRESEETDPDVLALDPNARRHSFKLRRVTEKTDVMMEAVPRGQFLITPGADNIEDAGLVGEQLLLTRSALVAMGYAKDDVWALSAYDDTEDDAEAQMGEDYTDQPAQMRKELQLVRVWDVYVRVDMDDDGIAELHRIVYGDGTSKGAGNPQSHVVLAMEPVDEAPYADVVKERDPHQFEGHSIFEDIAPIQRAKTWLMRAALDNVTAQNNQRMIVNGNAVSNPADIFKTGAPLLLEPGYNPADAINWEAVPFIADKAMEFMSYLDEVARDRTGIADESGGLDADNLHDTTATAAALMAQPGIAQADAIVRSLANGGLRRAFKGLLKLVIAHADGPRTVQIRGEWVQYDPRVWNVDMDCTVNVGLGGGTKERDLQILQVIYGMQKEIALTLGADNPFVKPKQLYNSLEKITQTAGFPSALPYFTEPDEQEVAAKLQEKKQRPDPEIMKIEAQGKVAMQLEQMKAQTGLQVKQAELGFQQQSEQMKAEVARDKERAQAEADLAVRREEAQLNAQLEAQKLQSQAAIEAQKLQLERERMAQERELKLIEMQAQVGMAQHNAANKATEDGERKAGESKSLTALQAALDAMNRPRRVLRDENGDIIGVEPVQ